MFSTTIGEGDVYVHRIAGGGGFGDPLERDPAAVRRDVANGKVSAAAAAADYGVVVDADGVVDENGTRSLRAERSEAHT
jgi:N-methylhydantoinase B